MLSLFFDRLNDLPFAPLAEDEVWVQYDGPKLGVARTSQRGVFYIYSALEEREGEDTAWMFVRVSEERLRLIRKGKVSLRDAFVEAANDEVFRVSEVQNNAHAWITRVRHQVPSQIDPADLASENSFLKAR